MRLAFPSLSAFLPAMCMNHHPSSSNFLCPAQHPRPLSVYARDALPSTRMRTPPARESQLIQSHFVIGPLRLQRLDRASRRPRPLPCCQPRGLWKWRHGRWHPRRTQVYEPQPHRGGQGTRAYPGRRSSRGTTDTIHIWNVLSLSSSSMSLTPTPYLSHPRLPVRCRWNRNGAETTAGESLRAAMQQTRTVCMLSFLGRLHETPRDSQTIYGAGSGGAPEDVCGSGVGGHLARRGQCCTPHVTVGQGLV